MNVRYETDRWNPLIGSRMELMMDIVEVLIEETRAIAICMAWDDEGADVIC